MEKHELEIEILPNGKVRVETFGVKGPQCMEYAEMMQKIVGSLQDKKLKTEFYETPPKVRIHQPQRNTRTPGG